MGAVKGRSDGDTIETESGRPCGRPATELILILVVPVFFPTTIFAAIKVMVTVVAPVESEKRSGVSAIVLIAGRPMTMPVFAATVQAISFSAVPIMHFLNETITIQDRNDATRNPSGNGRCRAGINKRAYGGNGHCIDEFTHDLLSLTSDLPLTHCSAIAA